MGRSKTYWILVAVAAIIAISGLVMTRWADASLHNTGRYIGWGGIALLFIARIFFGGRQQPPAPKSGPGVS